MLNLLLLLVVTLIPYPTAVLSRYGAWPSYMGAPTALSLAYSLLSSHIFRNGLSSIRMDPKQKRPRLRRSLVGALAYPSGTIAALRFPRVSVIVYLIVEVYHLVLARPSDKHGVNLAV